MNPILLVTEQRLRVRRLVRESSRRLQTIRLLVELRFNSETYSYLNSLDEKESIYPVDVIQCSPEEATRITVRSCLSVGVNMPMQASTHYDPLYIFTVHRGVRQSGRPAPLGPGCSPCHSVQRPPHSVSRDNDTCSFVWRQSL